MPPIQNSYVPCQCHKRCLQSASDSSEEAGNRGKEVIDEVSARIVKRIVRVNVKLIERAISVALCSGVLHPEVKTKGIAPLRTPVVLNWIPEQKWILSWPVTSGKRTASIVAAVPQYLGRVARPSPCFVSPPQLVRVPRSCAFCKGGVVRACAWQSA